MESIVRFSLFNVVKSHVPDLDIKEIDDIVTGYVLSVIEDLAEEEDPMEGLDCPGFKEMLVAYLPQSEILQEEELERWMLGLVDQFKLNTDSKIAPGLDIKLLIADTTKPAVNTRKIRHVSEESAEKEGRRRKGRLSENSESELDPELEAGLSLLTEMFPNCCQVEAMHCLTVTGNLERAVQLLIQRAEEGQQIKPSQTQLLAKLARPAELDDTQVKKNLMEQYGFVDKEEDQRYHRPNLLKNKDDKKLIRYREGKIVSTKGERFTQVTKEESLEMKRSIVNNFSSFAPF